MVLSITRAVGTNFIFSYRSSYNILLLYYIRRTGKQTFQGCVVGGLRRNKSKWITQSATGKDVTTPLMQRRNVSDNP